jgi:hypothetical protein
MSQATQQSARKSVVPHKRKRRNTFQFTLNKKATRWWRGVGPRRNNENFPFLAAKTFPLPFKFFFIYLFFFMGFCENRKICLNLAIVPSYLNNCTSLQ